MPDLVVLGGARANVFLGIGGGCFQASIHFLVTSPANRRNSLTVVDVDGDAVPDIVTNDPGVFLGNGDGTFESGGSFVAGVAPASVAVADFNADSFPDLVTANRVGDEVSVLLPEPAGALLLGMGAVMLAALARGRAGASRP